MVEPCPLIEISGAPYERGQDYGRKAKSRIAKGILHYSTQLKALSIGPAEIRELVSDYLPVIEQFDENYVIEMRGIAEGAEVSFEEIALLNARTEILKLAQRPDLREKLNAALERDGPDGCTAVVVMPEAAESGKLIHAQNWDWKAECAETAIVLHVRRDDGPDVLTFAEAGALVRCGMNSLGIAVTGNYLESDRDYTQVGVPLALIRRKVLDSENLAAAMRTVYSTPKSASNNMIVSHHGGVAIDFECAPDETFQVHPDRGLIVHANHFQSQVALSKLKDTGISNTPDSLYRDLRVRGLLEPDTGRITIERLKTALFDDFETPWSVCRPPRPSKASMPNNLSATVAMIVMEPASGTMEVSILPALNRTFQSFRLDGTTPLRKAAAS